MENIRFLRNTFGNSQGDVVKIEVVTIRDLYYTDGFDRWCYIEKAKEGIDFEYTDDIDDRTMSNE